MTNHTGALYARIAGKYVRYSHTGADVQRMQETIKGLDRRTREWNDEVTEKDKHISELQEMYNELKGDNLKLQAKVTELDVRLASWLADVAMQTK